jgi:hypothetical protein
LSSGGGGERGTIGGVVESNVGVSKEIYLEEPDRVIDGVSGGVTIKTMGV